MNGLSISNAANQTGIIIGTNGSVVLGTNVVPPDYGYQIIALNKLVCDQGKALDTLSMAVLFLSLSVGILIGMKVVEWFKKLGKP